MNESEVRDRLAKGRPVEFPAWGDRSDPGEREKRIVHADWIKALVGIDGACACQIQVKNAVIVGDLVLRGMTFHRYMIFENCDFEGRVILNLSHLCLSLLLTRCVLKGQWELRGAQIDGNCEFILCVFQDSASFADLAVKHTLNGSGSTFQAVNFERMTVGKSLRFRVRRDDEKGLFPVRFRGRVRFLDAVINGTAEFDSAEFLGEANFIRVRVAGDAFFRAATVDDDLQQIVGLQAPVRFAGPAFFARAQVSGDAEFGGATFEARTSFRNAQVQGDLGMNLVQFQGEADFIQLRVGGKANFTCARFASFANFELANVGSVALFRSANDQDITTTFGGEAKFLGAVMRAADFRGVRFCKFANFGRVKVADDIQFSPVPAAASASGIATTFDQNATFLNATIGGVFDFVDVRAVGTFELSGMTFGRIATDWRLLLNKQHPYDRHPYAQFEAFFRAAGNDREASEVYRERRRREFTEMRLKLASGKDEPFGTWIARAVHLLPDIALQLFQRYVLRYGVRPLRLLVFSALVLALGSRVFVQAGAVSPKGFPVKSTNVQLHTWEAFRYSVKLFVPGVDVPAGDWVPSNRMMSSFPMTFEAYGAFHRFAGILLLPLGIAALAGLLVPKERTGG